MAGRISSLFTSIIQHCDIFVDLHIGTFYSKNLPQLIIDINMGQVASLTEINNPITNEKHNVIPPIDGTILGRTQNQFVSPGFALFHVGHKKSAQ